MAEVLKNRRSFQCLEPCLWGGLFNPMPSTGAVYGCRLRVPSTGAVYRRRLRSRCEAPFCEAVAKRRLQVSLRVSFAGVVYGRRAGTAPSGTSASTGMSIWPTRNCARRRRGVGAGGYDQIPGPARREQPAGRALRVQWIIAFDAIRPSRATRPRRRRAESR